MSSQSTSGFRDEIATIDVAQEIDSTTRNLFLVSHVKCSEERWTEADVASEDKAIRIHEVDFIEAELGELRRRWMQDEVK